MGGMVEKISPGGSADRKTASPTSSKGGGGSVGGGGQAGSSADAIRSAFLSGQLKLDSRCPLDERQLYGITKSWKAINRNMSVTAINMFVRYDNINIQL